MFFIYLFIFYNYFLRWVAPPMTESPGVAWLMMPKRHRLGSWCLGGSSWSLGSASSGDACPGKGRRNTVEERERSAMAKKGGKMQHGSHSRGGAWAPREGNLSALWRPHNSSGKMMSHATFGHPWPLLMPHHFPPISFKYLYPSYFVLWWRFV